MAVDVHESAFFAKAKESEQALRVFLNTAADLQSTKQRLIDFRERQSDVGGLRSSLAMLRMTHDGYSGCWRIVAVAHARASLGMSGYG